MYQFNRHPTIVNCYAFHLVPRRMFLATPLMEAAYVSMRHGSPDRRAAALCRLEPLLVVLFLSIGASCFES
jgi:hypothetical protein